MIGFAHNVFDITNPGTYMAPIIRGVLTSDKTIPGKVYLNHCFALEKIHGRYYVIEAGWNKHTCKGEVIIVPFNEWKKGRPEGSFVVYNPEITYDSDIYFQRMFEAIGLPYDFNNILAQLYKLRTEVWIGNRSNKKFQCAKLVAYMLQLENYYRIDTEELFHLFINMTPIDINTLS